MSTGRRFYWPVLGVLALLGLVACEPYMSMTDQIPAQTRRAAALLPTQPRYVGMVNVETVLRHLQDLRGQNLADSLRQTDNPYVRRFLDATGVDPGADVEAIYAALEDESALSAVVFGDLTPAQMNRYLKQAPAGAGTATRYRETPLYRLTLGENPDGDTLSVAFVGSGTMVLSTDAGRVQAMVDRHHDGQGGLRANDTYMTLVKRVGRGSTAWLVGGDVLQTALGDSSAPAAVAAGKQALSKVNQAGLQRALSAWSDRVLGLSEVSSLPGRAEKRVRRLGRQLREQAVSLTLTDEALEGQVYLTMRDDASASSVVDVAEGAVAVMKLSSRELSQRHRDLLDDIRIERDGAVVHVQFALSRELLRKTVRAQRPAHRPHRAPSSGQFAGSSRPGVDSSIGRHHPPWAAVALRNSRPATQARRALSVLVRTAWHRLY